MIAARATEALPATDRLQPIALPRYPELRHRDSFDREYLLDVAAAATARTRPGSLPACWPLLDDREHIEAICRDYNDLAAENYLAADQLDEAKRRATAAERARDQAQAAADQARAELAIERAHHATAQGLLAASNEAAVRLQLRTMLLLAELTVTQQALAAIDSRYRALRVAFVTAEVIAELNANSRATQHGCCTTGVDIDATQVIDVDDVAATGGAR